MHAGSARWSRKPVAPHGVHPFDSDRLRHECSRDRGEWANIGASHAPAKRGARVAFRVRFPGSPPYLDGTKGGGLSPAGSRHRDIPVAQWREHRPPEPEIAVRPRAGMPGLVLALAIAGYAGVGPRQAHNLRTRVQIPPPRPHRLLSCSRSSDGRALGFEPRGRRFEPGRECHVPRSRRPKDRTQPCEG